MVGVIPGDVVMCRRPVGRGYVRVEETAEFPWQSEHDEPMLRQGHEFHHSRLENLDPSVQFAYRVQNFGGGMQVAQQINGNPSLLFNIIDQAAFPIAFDAKFVVSTQIIGVHEVRAGHSVS